ncbi:MAG: DUF1003 domain-containing protein [Rhizobiaceae bacterium]
MPKTIEDIARRYLSGRAGARERHVLESALHRQALSRDLSQDAGTTLGDRLADAIARVGGSWSFIVGFLAFLAVWTLANIWLLGMETFDPYPFVFLNLILSMLAAIQAPIIMMSQNRQAARDRVDAAHDYEVNLKSEIEIMALHEKLDELRHREIVGMHAEMTKLAEALERIEARLADTPR